MPHTAPRIVVVGGGFGGLYAATYLGRSELADHRAELTLLDRRNYFTFTPLLAEVAAGTLGREHVTTPFRTLGKRYGFAFVQDTACELDLEAQCVRTKHTTLPFDYLVLAVGAEPRYFGNGELQRSSLSFATVPDALTVRSRVICSLERAALTRDEAEQKRLLTFVVAGAGPAGVEVASEIRNLANEVVRPLYPDLPPAEVMIVDPGQRILNGWDPNLAREGLHRLRARGVDVRLQTRVERATPGTVILAGSDGTEPIAADTLVWTAGSGAVSWAGNLPVPTERGQIKVNHFLQIEGFENVFAVGDVTTLMDERSGRPYPRVAPIAISQGIRAAANIENHFFKRPLEPYHAHHAGKIVSLGDGIALVDILGVTVTGTIAWWIYRTAYLLKLVGIKNKIRVLVTLVLNRLFDPDISAEETPNPPTPPSVG